MSEYLSILLVDLLLPVGGTLAPAPSVPTPSGMLRLRAAAFGQGREGVGTRVRISLCESQVDQNIRDKIAKSEKRL